MDASVWVDSVYNVAKDTKGDSEGPVTISVRTGEMGGTVQICTIGKPSTDWYGKVDLCVSPEVAEALAAAILKKVKDLREEEAREVS